MSVSYSAIQVLGYLGHDPQPIPTENGVDGARFAVAVNRVWTNAASQRQEETDWFTIVTWGPLAESCLAHLKKGRLVFVAGRPRIHQWDDEQGGRFHQVQVLADRVIFLDAPASASK